MSQTFDSEISHYQQILHLPKRDACGSSSSSSIQNYDLGLHIFAVFLILLCGTTACSFPVLVKAFPKLAISRHALFVSRHFGTGVLIALAFAHLLPTAFENLWDECLPYFWTEGYDAMPGVIAMISALVVMLVEMVFTMQGVRHSHVPPSLENAEDESDRSQSRNTDQSKVCDLPRQARDEDATWRMASSNQAPKASEPPFQEDSAADTRHTSKSASTIRSDAASQQKAISEQQEGRMMLQCLLLEAGILFHSVFIGLSISLSSGTTFIALMVAISFHQIFEGLALGGRIAAIPSLRISSIKPWAMSFAVSLDLLFTHHAFVC